MSHTLLPHDRADSRPGRVTRTLLSDVIVGCAEAALGDQRPDGSFPPGCNGPYRDPETPVRNTAHWLITFAKAHRISGRQDLLDATHRAAGYLIAPAGRPHDASFLCRTGADKDHCNGVIGQAWVIEALVAASDEFGVPCYRELAATVFLRHAFDEQLGLWHRLEVDGRTERIDATFNHQLWFAAAGALIETDASGPIGSRVARFLDCAREAHLGIGPHGRIAHKIRLPRPQDGRSSGRAPQPARRRPRSRDVRREMGYHAFNLYAFALLRQRLPDHPLWSDPKLGAALRFANTERHVRALEDNEYAYPYNPVGFEVAFALQVFAPAHLRSPRTDYWWVARQLDRTYDRHARRLSRGTEDAATSSARLYEATRLRDLEISWRTHPSPGRAPGSTRSPGPPDPPSHPD
jgi:hypothetical protein